MKDHLMNLAAGVAAVSIGGTSMAGPGPVTIVQRSAMTLAGTAVDQHGASFGVTGLSGITYRGSGEFLAVMDNSNKIVRIQVGLAADGALTSASIGGGISVASVSDYEGIARVSGETVLLASETGPALFEYLIDDGSLVGQVALPAVYSNIRPNFGLESVTTHGASGDVWTVNEEALGVDGPTSSQASGSVVRLQRFGAPALGPTEQFAYVTDAWHGSAITGARSGVSDMVALPDGRLLALERSFAFSLQGFFKNTIYLIDATGATDTSAMPALAGGGFVPTAKQLVWSAYLNQNLEGLCLGAYLGNGHWSLVGVVDDADPISSNTIVSFDMHIGSYCRADFDADGVITVADIFAFLNAWFAGDSLADSYPVGLSVQDIFEFLNTWFMGGCP